MPSIFPHPKPYPIPLSRKRRNDYYWGYSAKLGRRVEFEHHLEYEHWILHEINPNIVTLCEQYPRMEDVQQGKRFKYTFDLYIRESNGKETCIEVKSKHKLVANEAGVLAPDKWDLAVDRARKWGVDCRFVTEEDIEPHHILIENWSQLLPFVQRALLEDLEKIETQILELVSDDMPQSLDSLTRKLKGVDHERVIAATSHLLHQGHLVAEDLATKPLNNWLIVNRVPKEPKHAA